MLTNPYTRRSAYAEAADAMRELEEDEERRARRRAVDEQAIQSAEGDDARHYGEHDEARARRTARAASGQKHLLGQGGWRYNR